MPKETELIELIRRKASMSQKIISDVDKDYALYVGAGERATGLAALNWILKTMKSNHLPETEAETLEFIMDLLKELGKAQFVSQEATEITLLGFILGDQSHVIRAKRDRADV